MILSKTGEQPGEQAVSIQTVPDHSQQQEFKIGCKPCESQQSPGGDARQVNQDQ